MIRRGPHRRAAARSNAAALVGSVLAFALVVASCGDSKQTTETTTTTVDPTSIPADHGLSADLAERVIASTVAVNGVACGRTSAGSGFAVSEDLIVTNAHVIVGMDAIQVHSLDGEEHAATAVAFDPVNDLALLRVQGVSFEALPRTAESADGSIGMLIGWEAAPFPDPTPYRINRAVTVRIEPVGGTEPVERPAYLLAASVDAGDSGAALVNDHGEVVGVVFATSVEVEGVGYAVRAGAVDDLIAKSLDPNLTIPGC